MIYIEPTAELTLPSGKTIYTKTWVKDIQKLLVERSATAVHRMTLEITKELQESNPKSTDLSSYSWFASVGAAPKGVAGLESSSKNRVDAFRSELRKGNASVNRRKFRSLVKNVKKDWEKSRRKRLNIVNNTYYVDDLDSRQPFVEEAVRRGIAEAEQKLKL